MRILAIFQHPIKAIITSFPKLREQNRLIRIHYRERLNARRALFYVHFFGPLKIIVNLPAQLWNSIMFEISLLLCLSENVIAAIFFLHELSSDPQKRGVTRYFCSLLNFFFFFKCKKCLCPWNCSPCGILLNLTRIIQPDYTYVHRGWELEIGSSRTRV